jgi:hypothetical protein
MYSERSTTVTPSKTAVIGILAVRHMNGKPHGGRLEHSEASNERPLGRAAPIEPRSVL